MLSLVRARASPAARPRAVVDGDLPGRTVLVVDDDARNLFALSGILELHGIRVLHAENGRKGIETLLAHPDVDAGPDGRDDAGDGRLRRHRGDPADARVRRSADHRGHREGDARRPGEEPRRRAPTTTSPSRSTPTTSWPASAAGSQSPRVTGRREDGAAEHPGGSAATGRSGSRGELATAAQDAPPTPRAALIELAKGILVERGSGRSAQAARQLDRAHRADRAAALELAVDIINQAARDRSREAPVRCAAGRPAADDRSATRCRTAAGGRERRAAADDTQAVAGLPAGARARPARRGAVAIWAAGPTTSLTLAGHAGFPPGEAARWRTCRRASASLAQRA